MVSVIRRRDDSSDDDGYRLKRTSGQKFALGAKAGAVATVVMTTFRLPISRSLPPTDEFWSTYVHRGSGDGNRLPALLLHLCYGMVGGVGYVMAVPELFRTSEAEAERRGVVTAVVYSLLLSAFGSRVLLDRLLDEELAADELLIFHLGHVVYGITLGAWLGSRGSE